jgi:hypothetical protein
MYARSTEVDYKGRKPGGDDPKCDRTVSLFY